AGQEVAFDEGELEKVSDIVRSQIDVGWRAFAFPRAARRNWRGGWRHRRRSVRLRGLRRGLLAARRGEGDRSRAAERGGGPTPLPLHHLGPAPTDFRAPPDSIRQLHCRCKSLACPATVSTQSSMNRPSKRSARPFKTHRASSRGA